MSIKEYLRDLNIVKYNLTKFYRNSVSEWLKKDLIKCIGAINKEIELYSFKKKEQDDYFKKNQLTIFDLGGM